ncbi:DNA polymerase III subunit beta [Boudabousia marimammalium]|uniref:Beta sliding clamp n=1 Tax=Boudabousia marimammalium TaxID=156892 RepID=A0A1Q5PT00_9ACTO|nr:DNA polymerase III subunit beta [Boudabousia marimammalium]OKL50678.1 DNA polymerase III subunit beta [Boudabousia marimammalium]
MEFTVQRDVIAEAVSWAARVVPPRPSIPILSGVHLQASEETLTISAFDYENSTKSEVPAEVNQPGDILVSGRLLSEIVKVLPHQNVTMKLEDSKVLLTCGATRFTLATMPVDEYPKLPQFPVLSGHIDADKLATAVNQVSIAASRDETLPLLTAIQVDIDGPKMTLMATDRYRLAMREILWHPQDMKMKANALVRAKVLSDVAKTMTSTGEVSLALSDATVPGAARIIGFTAGDRSTTSNQMDGDYPPVRRLFPESTPIYAVVNRQELLEATRRMKLAAERNTPVRLQFSDGTLSLQASQGDDVQGADALPATIVGENIQTAFNPTYLTEGLSVLTTEYVRMSFTHPSKPAVLTGQETVDGEEDLDFRYLLMPIRYGA